MSNTTDRDASHLDDIDDGCGCAEVWEHMSEQRVRRSEEVEE